MLTDWWQKIWFMQKPYSTTIEIALDMRETYMGGLRFGIIGCGMIGNVHANVIQDLEDASLVAVADQNLKLGSELGAGFGCASYQDYHELLARNDIDVVVVCVPSGLHCEITEDAARASKHVIVEKPIEITLERADRMIDACRMNNVMLSVILQHRFDDSIQALKKAVEKGEMGELYFGSSRTLWYRDPEYYLKSPWKGTWKSDGGGALINQSIHYIDLLQYIMGPIESVNGACRTLFHKTIEVEDVGIAVLRFKSGALGTIEGTTLAYPGICTELNIYGERGTFSIKNDQLNYYCLKSGAFPAFEDLLSKKEAQTTGASEAEGLDTESHKRQYMDVIDAIRNNRKPLIDGEEGKKSLELITEIYASCGFGEKIV